MSDPYSSNKRQTKRLPYYDYSQTGTYFVTIVTQGRLSLFGQIGDGEMELNEIGKMVAEVWMQIP